MDMELVSGIIRLGLPLFAICLAAACFDRVGIVHIGLDGQIGLASAAYVAATQITNGYLAVAVAFGIVAIFNVILTESVKRHELDGFLIGLALLYFGYGGAQLISQTASGKPGYLQLGAGNMGGGIPFFALIACCLMIWLLVDVVRPVRLAKTIAESSALAELEGVSVLQWSHAHALAATSLIATAGIFLSELGGSYTIGIGGERGFLALAFIAVARYRIWIALLLSTLFAALQKFGYQGHFPMELIESASFALAIGLVVWSGWNRRLRAE